MKEDSNQINLVEFAKEDKNPTLTKLNKQKEDTEKKKNKTEDALKANQESLQESEANIQVLQNGKDYIETVEKIKRAVEFYGYDKTKAELIKKNDEYKNQLKVTKNQLLNIMKN